MNNKANEGYTVVPGIDKERYQERNGLEGPFRSKNGKTVYYDPKEGKYYDPDTDMYIDHDEWDKMNTEGYDDEDGPTKYYVYLWGNWQSGKYYDYGHRTIIVPGSSPEEALEWVHDNQDAILAHYMNARSPAGKRLLPKMGANIFFDKTKVKGPAPVGHPLARVARDIESNRQSVTDEIANRISMGENIMDKWAPVAEGVRPGSRDAYQRDYDSSRTGFSQGRRGDDEYHVPDPDPVFQHNRQETMQYNVTVNGQPVNEKPFLGRSAALAWAKEQVTAGKLDPKVAKLSPMQYESLSEAARPSRAGSRPDRGHEPQKRYVTDRKTGKQYDPDEEFNKKMNSPEVKAQMKRMAQKEGVAEGQGDFDKAINNLHGWYEVDSGNPDIKEYEFDDREGGYYAQGTVKHSISTGRVKIEFEDRSGQYGEEDVNQTFNSIGDAMNVLRTITTQWKYNNGKAQNYNKLGGRDVAGPNDLYKTDRAGKKGTLTKSRMDTMKATSPGRVTGPKGPLPENFDAEYDDEAGMADNNIETMKRAVAGLDDLISKGDNLPEWCQEKIAVSKSMLVAVWDYMASEEQHVAENKKGVKAMKHTIKSSNPVAKNATAGHGGGAAGPMKNKKDVPPRKAKHKKKPELAESNWYNLRLQSILEQKLK